MNRFVRREMTRKKYGKTSDMHMGTYGVWVSFDKCKNVCGMQVEALEAHEANRHLQFSGPFEEGSSYVVEH